VTTDEIAALLFREARLLDEQRYDEWLALYLPDAWYWVPSRPDQASWKDTISIIYDDRQLMEMRVRRLMHPHAHAVQPPARTTRIVGNIEVEESRADDGLVRSIFQMIEFREDRQLIYGGTMRHRLVRRDSTLAIGWKRVELVNAAGVHEPITGIF
jgi:3-phenylpropionate/cinnamic acid dioxygenase small subunit